MPKFLFFKKEVKQVESSQVKEKKEEKVKEESRKEEAKLRKVEKLEELPYIVESIPSDAEIVEKYWIQEPFASVTIARLPSLGGILKYFVQEVQIRPLELKVLDKIIEIISAELDPMAIGREEDLRKALLKEGRRIINEYATRFRILRDKSVREKFYYFLERDFLGYGPLNVLMLDWRIEDISCDGVNTPIFVWHRKYESMPTNIQFQDRKYLDDYIVKLAHKSGKHVSSAFPIVDAMIYGKHRLAASFREEVSPKGSTFSIRKFREEPYSIVDLIDIGTLNDEMAAYLWLMMEHKASMLVIGGTAAGKTTLLNAIASMIKPGYKVVTVEETAELNIPIENWVQFVSRESYGLGETKIGEVTLYDLLKTSLRYRPDYIVVGEVRGEEAFVLFQAVATGHGGLCTIHGDSLESCIKRLTSPPMNVAISYIPLMNIAIVVERVVLPKSMSPIPFGRRATVVMEIEDYNRFIPIFEWSPTEDLFYSHVKDSIMMQRFAYKTGRTFEDMLNEINRRRRLLRYLRENNIRNNKEVFKYIAEYYTDANRLLDRLGIKLEVTPSIAVTANASRFIEESAFKVLNALNILSGASDKKSLLRATGMDEQELDKILSIFVNYGHVTISEEEGGIIRMTEKGKKTYSLISERMSKS
ncbi:MAG: type II/IV secretion system ATPase subunit [Nitrososphaerota archaeon]|nr:type II/IV secretion system ATPase subunit [Nitrososphaerota archaeon]